MNVCISEFIGGVFKGAITTSVYTRIILNWVRTPWAIIQIIHIIYFPAFFEIIGGFSIFIRRKTPVEGFHYLEMYFINTYLSLKGVTLMLLWKIIKGAMVGGEGALVRGMGNGFLQPLEEQKEGKHEKLNVLFLFSSLSTLIAFLDIFKEILKLGFSQKRNFFK